MARAVSLDLWPVRNNNIHEIPEHGLPHFTFQRSWDSSGNKGPLTSRHFYIQGQKLYNLTNRPPTRKPESHPIICLSVCFFKYSYGWRCHSCHLCKIWTFFGLSIHDVYNLENVGPPTSKKISLEKNVGLTECTMRSREWAPLFKQEAQLMLTTGSTRLAVNQGQQTQYHSICYI